MEGMKGGEHISAEPLGFRVNTVNFYSIFTICVKWESWNALHLSDLIKVP